MGNILVIAVLAVCFYFAIRYIVREHKAGRCIGCAESGGCASCHGSCSSCGNHEEEMRKLQEFRAMKARQAGEMTK